MSLLTYGPTFHHAIPVCEYLAQYGLLRSRRDVFQLDSATPRMKVADYFKLENRFKMLEMNDKPRVVEEHDGWAGVFSAVDAGTGVAIASDAFSYAFSDRIKLLSLTPEPKRVAIGIITRKGKLSPAAEKFCQCAKEAFAVIR